jgi:error-prone DNA polymerase
VPELELLFQDCPQAIASTLEIADRCTFDLTSELNYAFPGYPAPLGYTSESYLEKLCYEAVLKRYGSMTPAIKARLEKEFKLIRKYHLAGFLLLYHEVSRSGVRL